MASPVPLRDPFLLPVCRCGGAANLIAVEPDLLDSALTRRIYQCVDCHSLETFVSAKKVPPTLPLALPLAASDNPGG